MVNTDKLKTVIEPELTDCFCNKYGCHNLNFTPLTKVKDIFLGMEPDFVAYDNNQRILYIGEITTSGFNGQRGKNFHVGAVKKVAESFSKFYLILLENNIRKIKEKLLIQHPECDFNKISCHFIVPKGSKFIKSLRYREKLFETGIMRLDKLPLSDESEKIMRGILEKAKNEMKIK